MQIKQNSKLNACICRFIMIGANGLVDFYSDLVDILYSHSTEYSPPSTSSSSDHEFSLQKMDEKSLTDSLNQLFDGTMYKTNIDPYDDNDVIVYAIPTFQPSKSFLKNNQLSFMQDIEVTRNILFTTKKYFPKASVYISSAYLNPTTFMMKALEKFGLKDGQCDNKNGGSAYLLSAAPSSHGFKQKKNDAVNGSGKGWVPSVFLRLAEEISSKINPNGGKILLYDRDGFTFHAKGLWLTSGCTSTTSSNNNSMKENLNDDSQLRIESCQIDESENDLVASIIGSSNFGSRSELLDWESNCILVMNPVSKNEKVVNLKNAVAGDWNSMLKHCVEFGSRDDLKAGSQMNANWFISKMATKLARKYF